MRVPCSECLPVRHRLLSTIVAVLGLALSVWGQGSYRAQLRGIVSDATGAVVANATVTIRDVGTNISSSAHTDNKGSYFFTDLRPSTYVLKVEASGFRPAERTGVVLAVDQESSLDFKLEIGGVNQQVTVTAEVPVLESANGDRGLVVGSQEITEFIQSLLHFWRIRYRAVLDMSSVSLFGHRTVTGGIPELASG